MHRIQSSLVPYEADDEVKAGEEGAGMLSEEEEEEGRHKYNYFNGGSSLYTLPGAVVLASNFVFLFLSMQSLQQ